MIKLLILLIIFVLSIIPRMIRGYQQSRAYEKSFGVLEEKGFNNYYERLAFENRRLEVLEELTKKQILGQISEKSYDEAITSMAKREVEIDKKTGINRYELEEIIKQSEKANILSD